MKYILILLIFTPIALCAQLPSYSKHRSVDPVNWKNLICNPSEDTPYRVICSPEDTSINSVANYCDFRLITIFSGEKSLTVSNDVFHQRCAFELNKNSDLHSYSCKYMGLTLIGSPFKDKYKFNDISFMNDSFSQSCSFYNLKCRNIILGNGFYSEDLQVSNSEVHLLEIGQTNAPRVSIWNLKVDTLAIGNGDVVVKNVILRDFIGVNTILKVTPLQLNEMNFDYSGFNLNLNNRDTDFNYVMNLYSSLLANQKAHNFDFGYQKADIELRDYKLKYHPTVQDRFAKFWWNYGYNKDNIFRMTAWIFLGFFVTNLFLFCYLNDNTYTIKELKKRMIQESCHSAPWYRFLFYHFWLSFIYSCIIFFGIKLDVDKMKFTNIFLAIYIYAFYAIGLVCLVFIGNYILFK